MQHMDAALAAVPEIDDDARRRLHSYFRSGRALYLRVCWEGLPAATVVCECPSMPLRMPCAWPSMHAPLLHHHLPAYRHTCYFLVVAQEMRQSMRRQAAAAARGGAEAEQAQAVQHP